MATTKKYRFATNQGEVTIEAESLNWARILFQEKYGYWPEKEIYDDRAAATEAGATEDSYSTTAG